LIFRGCFPKIILCSQQINEQRKMVPKKMTLRTMSLTTVICILLMNGLPDRSACAQYAGGTGDPNTPYQIHATSALQHLALTPADWNSHFKLTGDIDLEGVLLTPIGSPGQPFTGRFDGNGLILFRVTIDQPTTWNVGLFGFVNDPNAEILNLELRDPNISGEYGVGAIVGTLNAGSVTNCTVSSGQVAGGVVAGAIAGVNSGTIFSCRSRSDVSGLNHIGGLVGANNGLIRNCDSSGPVSGLSQLGGLVGANFSGAIEESHSIGSVSGAGDPNSVEIGGLAGINESGGLIGNCYATGGVTGHSSLGGLVGFQSDGTIERSYSTGSVGGVSQSGGLVGSQSGASTVNNSFWDTQSSGQLLSAGGIGVSTPEMQFRMTFVNAGWDFQDETANGPDDIWRLPGCSPPIHSFQADPINISDLVIPFSGSGSELDPFAVESSLQLFLLGQCSLILDRHFLLTNNLDMTAFDGSGGNPVYEPIGSAATPFTGSFNGNGQSISNFTLITSNQDNLGLFGIIRGSDESDTLYDLTLVNPAVQADIGPDDRGDTVGALVGLVQAGTIRGCSVSGGSVTGDNSVGGLAGYNGGALVQCFSTASVTGTCPVSIAATTGGLVGENIGILDGCWSDGTVAGDRSVGGLTGENHGEIKDCHASGTVTGSKVTGGLVGCNYDEINDSYAIGQVNGADDVGGLTGENVGGDALISRCFATGSVDGTNKVGGLAGDNLGAIGNCYATGPVTGIAMVGGLVGDTHGKICHSYATSLVNNGVANLTIGGLAGRSRLDIVSSYWATDSSGQSISAGGSGKLMNALTFAATFVGWNCDSAWTIEEGASPPKLVWEIAPGDAFDGATLYAGGDGDENDPYLITTADQLAALSQTPCHWDQHFKLDTDINLGGIAMRPIGVQGLPFTGTFDGDGHAISGLTISLPTSSFVGLFGYIDDPDAEIRRLHIEDPNITGDGCVGNIAGFLVNGTIRECRTTSGSISGVNTVGGLVGGNCGLIENCRSSTSVSGDSLVGLLAGGNSGLVSNCYSVATVSGDSEVGGLVGNNFGSIDYCYHAGLVTGNSDVGGLVGINQGSETASVWDIQTTGQAGSALGTGKTTIEMKAISTYSDAGWDFTEDTVDGSEDFWRLCVDGVDYPRLRWEFPFADISCPHGVGIEDLITLSEAWLLRGLDFDVGIDGRDGRVDFFDWAALHNDQLETITDDLPALASEWLKDGSRLKPFSPVPNDEIFNLHEFALLRSEWLEEF
jgi:hypothetical protein